MYGQELILDLHSCNSDKFTRNHIEQYFVELCDLIGMERCDLHFWDYEGEEEEYNKAPDHLKGTSAIQFITTSNITIHTLDVLQKVFLNIFSCSTFDPSIVQKYSEEFFEGLTVNIHSIKRL